MKYRSIQQRGWILKMLRGEARHKRLCMIWFGLQAMSRTSKSTETGSDWQLPGARGGRNGVWLLILGFFEGDEKACPLKPLQAGLCEWNQGELRPGAQGAHEHQLARQGWKSTIRAWPLGSPPKYIWPQILFVAISWYYEPNTLACVPCHHREPFTLAPFRRTSCTQRST